MKFRLDSKSTNYVNERLQMVIGAVAKGNTPDNTLRVLYKMRYKFAPNSLDIYLSRGERAVLLEMLYYRQQKLAETNNISEEMDLIQSVMEVIE